MSQGPLERAVAYVGRLPATIGRGLDRLARLPAPLSWPVRFFSSVWLGLVWLALVGAYVAVGSGWASLRARLEMTDMEFFDAWPMVVLMVLLCLNLIVVTLRRIPFTLHRLGVWMVHVGIVVLIVGCFLYFGGKFEGSTRIYLNQTVSHYYDATDRAFYVQRVDPNDFTKPVGPEVMLPVKHMPYFHEHQAETTTGTVGDPLDLAVPADALAREDPALAGLALKVTGYYPYAQMEGRWMAGPASAPADNPGLEIGLWLGEQSAGQWLLSRSPTERVMDAPDAPFGLEYVYHPTKERLAELNAEFTGNQAITVRVPSRNITKTYIIEPDKPIVVEGTPYTLTPREVMVMPMRSKGYEGLSPAMLMLDVVRKEADGQDFSFRRQAVFRFTERSPDFITENGQPRRVQDRIDHDLQVVYHDATRDQIYLVEDEAGALTLLHRAVGGAVERQPVALKTRVQVRIGNGVDMTLGVLVRTPRAVMAWKPRWVPPEFRSRTPTAQDIIRFSVAELTVARGSYQETKVAVPFMEYATPDPRPGVDRLPVIVQVPDVGPVRILMSTVRRPLPVSLKLERFDVVKYPGAVRSIADYVSTIRFTDPQKGQSWVEPVQLNETGAARGMVFFQSQWDGDEAAPPESRYTVLGVGNRPGVWAAVLGSILIAAGVLYAFYVKPLLLRMRKARLAATVQAEDGGLR